MKVKYLVFAFGVLLCATRGFADEIIIQPSIDRVTVHPNSAIVTRKASIAVLPGSHKLIITNLPADLDTARLQLSINHPNVRFGSIDVLKINNSDDREQQIKTLEQKIQSLKDQGQENEDLVSVANAQMQLMSSLVNAKIDSSTWTNFKAAELDALLLSVNKNAGSALESTRQAKVRQRALNLQIRELEKEISSLQSQQITYSAVHANIEALASIETAVSLSYPVSEASWHWLYEARLDTEAKAVALVRQAAVKQSTDENWNNVAVSITTADPRQSTTTPELNSVFVKWQEENGDGRHEISRRRAFQSIAQANLPRLEYGQPVDVIEEIIVTGTHIRGDSFERLRPYREIATIAQDPFQTKRPADIVSTQYLVDFNVPGRVDVPNESQEKLLTIVESFYDVELVTRVVPAAELAAFLEAEFLYTDNIPLPAATMYLYRDGAYIGKTTTEPFLPGEDIKLAFGIDDLIRVEQIAEEENSAEAGTFGRTSLIQSRLRYDLVSFHEHAIELEVVGRIPVTRDKKIGVEIPVTATAASKEDFEGASGIRSWQVTLHPREKASIYHHVDIRYPKDSMLSFANN
jgi:phage shock protein A